MSKRTDLEAVTAKLRKWADDLERWRNDDEEGYFELIALACDLEQWLIDQGIVARIDEPVTAEKESA